MSQFDEVRARMVEHQVIARGVRDARVLAALRAVPRHVFLPDSLAELAYSDSPLPLEHGQTISQPFIVAVMLEAAEVRADERILEIGTGSGYAAAVAAEIAGHVDTVERHRSLADQARSTLAALGYMNIDVFCGDGTHGLPERAPFDAIIATAAGPAIPRSWRAQLAVGGRLVMPVGPGRDRQRLILLTRRGEEAFAEKDLGAVSFVPLIGAQGWPGTSG